MFIELDPEYPIIGARIVLKEGYDISKGTLYKCEIVNLDARVVDVFYDCELLDCYFSLHGRKYKRVVIDKYRNIVWTGYKED